MEIIKGDLIELAKLGHFDLIAHGCNCQHNFGKGIAKTIAKQFPDAEATDKDTPTPKLGDISIGYEAKYDLNIVNCYTQIWYGKPYGMNPRNHLRSDTAHARYAAIRDCLIKINEHPNFDGLHIGLPLIGCGLAGLEWKIVKSYFEEHLTNLDVTVVKYNKK